MNRYIRSEQTIEFKEEAFMFNPRAYKVSEDSYELCNNEDLFIGEVYFQDYYRFKPSRSDVVYNENFIGMVLNTLNQTIFIPKDYYVYLVFVNRKLRYIGKGFNSRFRHAISGVSHVFQLNRDYFTGKLMEVCCYADGMEEQHACNLESALIKLWYNRETENLYNIRDTVESCSYKPHESEEDFYEHCRYDLLGCKVHEQTTYEAQIDFEEYIYR